jgi:hypothetical protein
VYFWVYLFDVIFYPLHLQWFIWRYESPSPEKSGAFVILCPKQYEGSHTLGGFGVFFRGYFMPLTDTEVRLLLGL